MCDLPDYLVVVSIYKLSPALGPGSETEITDSEEITRVFMNMTSLRDYDYTPRGPPPSTPIHTLSVLVDE